jgi:hypothetical protein
MGDHKQNMALEEASLIMDYEELNLQEKVINITHIASDLLNLKITVKDKGKKMWYAIRKKNCPILVLAGVSQWSEEHNEPIHFGTQTRRGKIPSPTEFAKHMDFQIDTKGSTGGKKQSEPINTIQGIVNTLQRYCQYQPT